MDKRKKMREFANALALTLYNTDAVKWPIRSKWAISSVGHLYAAEYMEQLSRLVQNYNTNDWPSVFSNSLSLLRVSHHVIDGLEKAKTDKFQIAKYIWMIIEVTDVLTKGASLASKNHILHTNAEIEVIYDCYQHMKCRQDLGELLKLSALLWAYADSLYFQGKEMCCEYQGLYTLDNGLKVLIRDYKNFNPIDLWPEITFDTEIRNIRIVTFHKHDFSIAMDVYNNMHVLNGNFKDSCVAGLLFVDGKRIDAPAITKLIDFFLKKLEKQTRFVNSLSREELYRKYVYLFWYRKKYLADYLRLPWKPSEAVFEALKLHNIPNIEESLNASMSSIQEKYDYSIYI